VCFNENRAPERSREYWWDVLSSVVYGLPVAAAFISFAASAAATRRTGWIGCRIRVQDSLRSESFSPPILAPTISAAPLGLSCPRTSLQGSWPCSHHARRSILVSLLPTAPAHGIPCHGRKFFIKKTIKKNTTETLPDRDQKWGKKNRNRKIKLVSKETKMPRILGKSSKVGNKQERRMRVSGRRRNVGTWVGFYIRRRDVGRGVEITIRRVNNSTCQLVTYVYNSSLFMSISNLIRINVKNIMGTYWVHFIFFSIFNNFLKVKWKFLFKFRFSSREQHMIIFYCFNISYEIIEKNRRNESGVEFHSETHKNWEMRKGNQNKNKNVTKGESAKFIYLKRIINQLNFL
jgi:hypothetical protein